MCAGGVPSGRWGTWPQCLTRGYGAIRTLLRLISTGVVHDATSIIVEFRGRGKGLPGLVSVWKIRRAGLDTYDLSNHFAMTALFLQRLLVFPFCEHFPGTWILILILKIKCFGGEVQLSISSAFDALNVGCSCTSCVLWCVGVSLCDSIAVIGYC